MSSMLVEAVGGAAFEVVAAAATVAAASVAGLVLCSRKRDGRQPPALEETAAPARKKRRQQPPAGPHSVAGAGGNRKERTVVFNGVAVSTEPVVEELKRRAAAAKWRHKIVYTFLDDRGRETTNYTLEEVDRAARRVAGALQRDAGVQKGDRVVLCFPPGLDFALAFWGCLYAGAVGVPVYPPYPGTLAKDLPKFNRMVADSGARVVLTNKTYHLASKMATVKGFFSSAGGVSWPEDVSWVTTDALADSLADEFEDVALSAGDTAFFQYSSGSTSEPKAVMVSHGNLRAQLKTWESIDASDTLVSWLPSYHDMGLVGFILAPAVFAARCVSMSPISFIKDPALWMRTASAYRASHVCAPNFGYALAARKTTDAQAAAMDLRALKQAICAAEPIRPESLDAFTAKFQPRAGFDPATFNCGYGLAEVTLVCTGQDPLARRLPTVLAVDKAQLETRQKVVELPTDATSTAAGAKKDGAALLVGCGKAMPTFTVAIVDPATRTPLGELAVGEVWVQGPSVAMGYWQREALTQEAFGARLAGGKTRAGDVFLRTGDLGFLRRGELFVTGRLKDLIIVRGRNVSPQDVEATVERAHEHVRPGCSAAFSVETARQEEALVVVAEVKAGSSREVLREACADVVRAVLAEHQLRCEAVVLLPQRTIPKTTSGKIQRSACKARFLAGSLPTSVWEHRAKDAAAAEPKAGPKDRDTAKDKDKDKKATATTAEPGEAAAKAGGVAVKTPDEILAWLLAQVAASEALEGSGAAPEGEGETERGTGTETETETPAAPAAVDPSTPWAMLGLDSVAVVGLSSELGEFLGCVVPPSAFFQYDSPLKLAHAPGLATGELEADEGGATAAGALAGAAAPLAASVEEIDASCYEVARFPEVQGLLGQMREFEQAGLRVPFLETLTPETRRMTNFNTYNYLGNARDERVLDAARAAIGEYGATMSSSPIVGQTQVNVDLEAALCGFFGAEASVLLVGGWVTNVTTIDALVGKGDLLLCDALNHDSCVTGQRLSGAAVLPFPHNDMRALERMLATLRTRYRRVLIVVEGVYSMDGDVPDLPELVRLKRQYKAMLFLDEAHSFGTMGASGRGVCEHFGLDPALVDVRMGTMSKALGSIGGFVLGSAPLVQFLKHCAGGFVFSVGLAPSAAAAALASLRLMADGPARTERLQANSRRFFDACRRRRLPVGARTLRGGPVVVVTLGSTLATARASEFLARHGVNVKPIVYPAVEEGKCRLRFFISAEHAPEELDRTADLLATYMQSVQAAAGEEGEEGGRGDEPAAAATSGPSETSAGEAPAKKKKKKKSKKKKATGSA